LKFKLGDTDRSDVLRLNIELENARMELVNAQESLFRSRVRLNNLLNVPEETENNLEYQPFDVEMYKNRTGRFVKYFRTGLGLRIMRDFFAEEAHANSAELESIEASIRQVESDKEAIKSKFLPTLGLTADIFKQVQEDSIGLSAANQSAFDDKFENGWSAKLNLRIPLFIGGSRFKELNQAFH
jgi:outer membrane protein TolC